ncbi:MAG: ABC transporter ATP-binding protein [Caldibacillus debilis]|jgi:ABC-type multidrug transport system fused ATPase/permease subunit|uniref:ABC-type multidrug transport system, ATPase and permease component n=5 Tax=Caldibacillus debilis TaxID=301148 RepID=A0A420VJG7_9BACI|nr:ABC transporter ATP-binding protein [Caldibacillus debilis]MBO2480588.1 ABC transporter ATP-binding protein [Bacillaceae bacterium]MBY6273676.1 ABC transporter ATP-binding protein [Bacillaceae bacterium]REJ29568.1 MAG: ABC transporter ATP-binding protein [Caldibacillus debilis]RKO63821.1 ABC-type multidrug transport system, ATPase and permease component [Caldibacillus debilis GB1]
MDTFRKLKSYYLPYKKYFYLSTVFLIFVTAITLIYPVILQITIDEVVRKGKYQYIPYLSIGFVLIMAVKGIMTYIQQYCGDLFGISAVYRLRNALYKKLQYLPFRFYDNAKTGDLMSRLTADVEGIRFFLSYGIAELIRFLLLVGTSIAIMLYYSVPLTAVTVLSLPFLLVAVRKFDRAVHPAFRAVRKSFGRLNTKVQENISGIHTVKALSKEDFEIERFDEFNTDFREKNIFNANIWAKYFPLMEFIGNLSVVLLLSYGGLMVINGRLQPGELVAFYSLVGFLIFPIMNLGFIINMFSQAKASGERLLEILEEPEDIREKPDAVRNVRFRGEVEFRGVTMKYTGDNQEAVEDISFHVRPGQIIGLIGPTGSGKTTITQLLARFYEPQKGEVLIDGRNIKDYSLYTLRSQIGYVPQESFLFSSTIKANIAYGRPDATMEEIIEAAKRAQAHDFIMELPDGYDTVLGERGLGLSGGQKQRIAIARAICMNPSILILDDATSAVDMETEFAIQKALREVMKGRTTFIIAHRISSLKHADEILVLENGRIVERGTHEFLLQNGGLYRRIYDIQYRDQAAVLQTQTE